VKGILAIISLGIVAFVAASVRADDVRDAAASYFQAAKLITVDCPATSVKMVDEWPPYSDAWIQMESFALEADVPAFGLAHQAALAEHAYWPGDADVSVYPPIQRLAEHMGDAAQYLDMRGDETAALATVGHMLRLADQLDQDPDAPYIRDLIASSIRAIAAYRVHIIASGVRLTRNPADKTDLQIHAAREFIRKLLEQKDPDERLKNIRQFLSDRSIRAGTETFHRINAELSMGAMSLGCHMYFFDRHRWPTSVGELVPNFLGKIPLDPWGDGKETLGYVLIKGGLPGGLDRPLVYSRCGSADGLFYRVNEPEYGFYNPLSDKKEGGQFRDVARWKPDERAFKVPTTQPIPSNAG
jgi:hypothetical protein